MKKFLLGALALLVAGSVMTGCKGKNNNGGSSEVTQLTLSKSSVKMALTVYDAEKGVEEANTDRFTITPKDGEYEVTASIEDIVSAKVSKNVVSLTALNIGRTTLTVTDTKTKATAKYEVEVVSVIESLEFTQATVSYYNGDDYLAQLDTVDSVFSWVRAPQDTVYLRAFLVDVDVHLFSDGFYVNDNGEYDGTSVGYMALLPGKAWYAPEGMNADRGFEYSATITEGVWATLDTVMSKALTRGTFTNGPQAFEHVKSAIGSFNAWIAADYESASDLENFQREMTIADTMAFKGSQLLRFTYMASAGGYGIDFMPAAIVTDAAMRLSGGNNSKYMYSVPAVEMTLVPLEGDNGWGVKVEQNAITNQYNLISDGFEFGKEYIYRHIAEQTTESAPARKAMQFDRYILTEKPKNVVSKY